MRIRVFVCMIMISTMLASCGSSKSDTGYDELKEQYEELEEDYQVLVEQYEVLKAEMDLLKFSTNTDIGNDIFGGEPVEDVKKETISGVEFLPVYENASITLSDTAIEMLQKSYDDIEAIYEYKKSDVVYDVGTFFGTRDYAYYKPDGKIKYGLTDVIIGEEAIRLGKFLKRALDYDATNDTLVCLEFCIALEEEYTLSASGSYNSIMIGCKAYNYDGDDSSKKTRSFQSSSDDPIRAMWVNKPLPGKVCVVYQFFSMPVNTKEFIVTNNDYVHIGVNVEEWK